MNDYYRRSLRLLFLLVRGSGASGPDAPPGYPTMFDGETKLQALEFWVRYPDYLADELINLAVGTGQSEFATAARKIFDDEEPDLRRVPMLRRFFGAYEPLDTVLGILKSRQLVLPKTRKLRDNANHRVFYVAEKAQSFLTAVLEAYPSLDWYDRRAALVIQVSGGAGGGALKERQHRQEEYHAARVDDLIPTIAQRVRHRLDEWEREHGAV